MSNNLYTLYANLMKPQSFAAWAKPKAEDLNIPRKRYLNDDNAVVWNIGDEAGSCADHIEMAGFYSSTIISYGKDKKGRLKLMKHLVVPTLRTQPNVTQSSFCYNFNASPVDIKIQLVNIQRKYLLKVILKSILPLILMLVLFVNFCLLFISLH